MDFGWIDSTVLDNIDFTLPADAPITSRVLAGSPAETKIYIGLSKWGRKEFIGRLYPKGTKEKQFLDEYVKHFNYVELNATHHQAYTKEQVEKWAAKATGLDFKFCPKFPQSISHYSTLTNAGEQTREFLESMTGFGENLGPMFIQLSDKYSPNRKDNLYTYIKSLPSEASIHLEVRHPDWFTKQSSTELFEQMNSAGVGTVLTDTPGRRDVCHMALTTPILFLRFVCYGDHPTDIERILAWKARIQHWTSRGLNEAYICLHCHNYNAEVEFAQYVQSIFANPKNQL